ncbi:growth arrest-specific protein 1-like [Haliotis rufescens]|uniref:growth arrest-specific protein 1-like n=1 Tax=Haliotis rufescens TaxID=6454 RepID=UPI001EAF9555|nr:growth arrest-specific protein 1-like [Haliotis rufescens]
MHVWDLCLLAMCIQTSHCIFSSGVPEFCDQARNHCFSRIGCQMALNNFMIGCSDVIKGTVDTCTTDCKHALISLLSTEDRSGIAFVNCNCSDDEFCETQKRRVEICAKDVMEFMNNINDNAVVSCGLAMWICEADTSCLAALQYYIRHCAKLMNGESCSARCNNSLDILYRQTSSKMLQSCECDGTEDYNCQTLKDNTERLCFNRQPRVAYTVSGKSEVTSSGSNSFKTNSGILLLVVNISLLLYRDVFLLYRKAFLNPQW